MRTTIYMEGSRWMMRATHRETGESFTMSCATHAQAEWEAYVASHC